MPTSQLAIAAAVLLAAVGAAAAQAPVTVAHDGSKTRLIDFTDPTSGGRIRQIYNPAGDEHNLYHYRCVFNADNSRLLGIETPKGTTDYRVTLYDGDGRFLKTLFTQKEFNWTLAWDHHDPRVFYTRSGRTVYRYDVEAGKAVPVRSFSAPSITSGPTGLSLNQNGDRLLLRMSDNTVRSYRLPGMDDEHVTTIEIPDAGMRTGTSCALSGTRTVSPWKLRKSNRLRRLGRGRRRFAFMTGSQAHCFIRAMESASVTMTSRRTANWLTSKDSIKAAT